MYKEVESLTIPGNTLDNVQGTSAIPKGIPFREGHIPIFSIVSLSGDGNKEEVSNTRLIKVSQIHGRSYEMRFDKTEKILFSDEYNNVYSTLTVKGNNLNAPRVLKNSISPSGFLIFGLQDSDAMVRTLRASEVLRFHNIETEIIIKVIEPECLPIKGKFVPVTDFKRQLVQQVWIENAREDYIDQTGLTKVKRDDIPALSSALEKMTFFFTVRGHQVSERLQDLTQPETKEEFKIVMKRIFKYTNKIKEINNKNNPTYAPKLFDAEKDDDIEEYLVEYLPKRLARNFARMHNIGLVHSYPHIGNISAVGSIYDLDSVRGEPLGIGDVAVTDEDMQRDIDSLISGESFAEGVLAVFNDLQKKNFVKNDQPLREKFEEVFYKEYVTGRGWEDNMIENLSKIFNFFKKFEPIRERYMFLPHYLSLLSSHVGWTYLYPEDTTQLQLKYLQVSKLENHTCFDEIKNNISLDQKYAQRQQRINTYDNASGLVAYKENYGQYLGILEEDIRGQLNDELQMIESKFGKETADMIVVMHILENNKRFFSEIVSKDEDREGETEFREQYNFFYRAIRNEGWEEDVISHLRNIYKLFEGFEFDSTREYFDHYIPLLTDQIGKDFNYQENIRQVLEAYIDWEEVQIERHLNKAIEDAPPDTDIPDLIESIYEERGYDAEVTEMPWEQDDWDAFLVERICNQIEDQLKPELDSITKKYGEEVIGDIVHMLLKKARFQLEKEYDPIVEVWVTAAQEFISREIKEEYLNKYKKEIKRDEDDRK